MASESITLKVPGILAQGWRSRGTSYGGFGQENAPENAFVVTNKRILFLVVPIYGTGKIMGGMSLSNIQWVFAAGKIEKKLEELLSSNSLDSILSTNEKNFVINLNELKKVKIRSFFGARVTFVKNDGSKFKYTLRDKNKLKDLKRIFAIYL